MSTEPATSEPLSFYQGQPISREQAGTQLAELRNDPEWLARWNAKDANAIAENTALYRIRQGMPPEPLPDPTPEQIRQTMQDRDREIDEARLSTWEQHIRMDDQMRLEHRRGLVTKEQSDTAKREIEKMKSDAAFCRLVLAGNIDARDKWMRWGRIASMQVAPPDHDWSK